MDLVQQLINLVQSLTTRLNEIASNSKTNEELPSMNPINRDALIRGSVNGVSSTFTPQDILDEVVIPQPVPWNAVIQKGIVHVVGLTYYVWYNGFAINGVQYNQQGSALITLNPGDPTNPRIDVFVVALVSGVGQIQVVEGTPAVSPVKPSIDLNTQSEISFRLVAAGETVDPNIISEMVYNENTGEPGEWANTFLLTGGNLGATGSAFLGSTYIEVIDETVPVDPRIVFDNDSPIPYNAQDLFVFALKTQASWESVSYLQIKLINTVSSDYKAFSLNHNNVADYGFSDSFTDWQVVGIPLSEFFSFIPSGPSGDFEFDRVEFSFNVSHSGETQVYIDMDWINIQSGSPQTPQQTGIPEENVIGNVLRRTDVNDLGSENVLDWAQFFAFDFVMNGDSTFTDVNLPSGDKSQRKRMYLTGNHTPTFPAYWVKAFDSQDYDGSAVNEVEIFCLNGEQGSEVVYYKIKNTAVSGGGSGSLEAYNASTNTPDLDSSPSGISKSDHYYVTVPGTFFTEDVQVGDLLIAKIDNPTALGDWVILERNVDIDFDPADLFLKDGSVPMDGMLKLAQDVIPSAGTLDISSATGNFLIVTGSTPISGISAGTQPGHFLFIQFVPGIELQSSGSFYLPDGQNITTNGGDRAMFVYGGGGSWTCWGYWADQGSSFGLSPVEVSDAGNSLPCRHTRGRICNFMESSSPNSNTEYIFDYNILGAWEYVKINAASEPHVRSSYTLVATALFAGYICKIATVGTTDFTAIGSPDNNVGTIFTATGTGTGDGTVHRVCPVVAGSPFQVSTDMYMMVRNLTSDVPEMYFEKIT